MEEGVEETERVIGDFDPLLEVLLLPGLIGFAKRFESIEATTAATAAAGEPPADAATAAAAAASNSDIVDEDNIDSVFGFCPLLISDANLSYFNAIFGN